MLEAEINDIRNDLYNYLVRQTGDANKSADITQEAFLRVIKKEFKEKEVDQFRAYLFRTAHNVMIDSYREKKRHPDHSEVEEDAVETIPDYSDTDSLKALIKHEMESCIKDLQLELSDDDRQALGLIVYGGFKIKEAAEFLNVSFETMKVKIYRARKRLQKLMDENCSIGVDEDGKISCEKKCDCNQ